MNLQGKRVTVMGLGRFGGGVGAVRFLHRRGAKLLVTDQADATTLRASLDHLADLRDIAYRLGTHDQRDFEQTDLVCASPAVKPGNKYLDAAQQAGVPITSEIQLLAAHLPSRAHTIGVTGTAGKSTVTAMIGHMLRKMAEGGSPTADRGENANDPPSAIHHPPSVFVGGNLGGSLLPEVDRIGAHDWVVLELSSFMLDRLRADRWSPHVAVITNFQPNHLDWHGSVEHYRAAKQVIYDFQSEREKDIAIGGPGVHDTFDNRVSDFRTFDDISGPPVELALPGDHNQLNARLASTAVHAALDVPEWQPLEALRDFTGLPHRLQLVAERDGVRYYNDSKSTTPEAAILAIDSFAARTAHLILGGSDKGSDLTAMARHAAQRCRVVYTIGDTGETIADAAHGSAEVVRCGDLPTALRHIAQRVRSGEAVVLSPGCASYDQYDNFEQRGEHFTELVRA